MSKQAISEQLANFDTLPNSAMVDVKTVAGLLGRAVGSVWRDAKLGTIPKPVKIGPATTRWNVGELRRHLASLGVVA